ncbi:type II toxin-antitoxin system VapC family toxin [Candidatus Pyrohabitans sp.]
METLCLDTDVLIDFLRGNPATANEIRQLEDEFELTTTTINLFELYYGAFKTEKAEKNVKSVNELAGRLEPLKFTDESAEFSGRIIAELEKEGRLVDFRDAMIAGIVLENNALLYTRNLRHFRRIRGIRLYEV